ncbi:speckle-type POZ protein-like [Planococcus citri]|uniref:speckle-type POZ protein-like n=1 Tax=Planococcus citri TaxID=170843 RepID=UPI0031F818E6
MNMNTFYTILTAFLLSYCTTDQSEPSKLPSNSHIEDFIRSDTYLRTHEINHIWAIHQFRFHEQIEENSIFSPDLRAPTTDRYEWQIEINPNGEDNNNDTISVYVCRNDDSAVEEATAEKNISIINNKKEVLLHKYDSPTKYARAYGYGFNCWGWPNFCKKNDYFRNHLLQNDTLTLSIHIKWLSESPTEVIQHVSSTSTAPGTTTIKFNLTGNLESMLENPKFADVVFITNGSSYPAHKNILSARSPIFAAMFRRKDSKNEKLKKIRINVTSMNEKVLRAMLRYIYTGKCEQLGELTDRFFEAATKYGVNGLRETCEQAHNKTMLG